MVCGRWKLVLLKVNTNYIVKRYNTILYLLLCLISAQSFGQSEMIVYGTDMYISENENMGVYCDFKAEGVSEIRNEGSIFFKGLYFENSSDEYLFTGKGRISFVSDNELNIIGSSSTRLNRALFNNTSGLPILLSNNITITDSLIMNAGIIKTYDHYVSFENPDSSAFVIDKFVKSPLAYISGELKLPAAKEMFFPVGSDQAYSPAKIYSRFPRVNDISIRFDEYAYLDLAEPVYEEDIAYREIYQDGSWIVKSDIIDPEGSMDLLAYINNFHDYPFNRNKFGLIYRDFDYLADDIWDIQGDLPDLFSPTRLSSSPVVLRSDIKRFGEFALADISPLEDEWPNFYSKHNSTFSYLVIPELSKYKNNKLAVYHRWGRLVYEQDDYQNDYDLSKLPVDTYYYVLFYEGRDGQVRSKQEFVEIVH